MTLSFSFNCFINCHLTEVFIPLFPYLFSSLSASLRSLSYRVYLACGCLLPLRTACLIALCLQLLTKTVDHKFCTDHGDTVGTGHVIPRGIRPVGISRCNILSCTAIL